MITAEAITTTQNAKKNSINHWVLHLLLIVILALELFSVILSTPVLILSAIHHFVITTHVRHPQLEAQLSTCLDIAYRERSGLASMLVNFDSQNHNAACGQFPHC